MAGGFPAGLTRRGALGAAAGVGVAGLVGARPAAAARQPRSEITTFVVVTGASGTPGVLNDLSLLGHRSVGVDLPGHGVTSGQFALDYQAPQNLISLATRPSPMRGIGLADFAAAGIAVVKRMARFGPVVLYGGSMGGATLNMVGNAVPHLISHIVYDSAFCCVELPSPDAYFATPEGSTSLAASLAGLAVGDPAQLGAVRANYRTADVLTLAAVREAIMAGASDAEFYGLLASLQPDESLTVGSEDSRVQAKTWGRIPRTYIRHTRDKLIPLALQDRMIAEADKLTPRNRFRVHSIDAAHAADAKAFGRVIEILDALAAG